MGSQCVLTLFIIGRDDWQRDGPLHEVLIPLLSDPQLRIVWEDPAAQFLYRVHRLGWLTPRCKHLLTRAFQLCYATLYPRYAWFIYTRRHLSIPGRAQFLQRWLPRFCKPQQTVILSRSAGGRLATLAADAMGVRGVICLGYPFCHPECDDEPERYQHLPFVQTPCLILQGARDVYGDEVTALRYPLAPTTRLQFWPTDHDFLLDAQGAHAVATAIRQWISELPPVR